MLKKFIKNLFLFNYLLIVRNFILKIILKIKINFKNQKNLNIIVGASKTNYKNWISTDQNTLNLTLISDWKFLFKYNSLNNILAEHVFEHLTVSDAKIACENCHKFLRKGGNLRIAVPDGFPDKEYIDLVKPGGSGLGAKDHKKLYNFRSIQHIFDPNLFSFEFIEFFDHNGKFKNKFLDDKKGYIMRSRYNDERNTVNKINYTSLILDLIKK